jgi:putative SOS response-associated peptidase YedK
MCNDYGNYVDYDDYLAAFSQIRIPVTWPNAIPNLQSSKLQSRDDIWPTDKVIAIRRFEDGPNEFDEFRLGFPPAQPKRPAGSTMTGEGRLEPSDHRLTRSVIGAPRSVPWSDRRSLQRSDNGRPP